MRDRSERFTTFEISTKQYHQHMTELAFLAKEAKRIINRMGCEREVS